LADAEFEAALRQLAMQQGMDVERLRRERGEDWLRNYRFLLTRDRALQEAVRERLAAQEGGVEEDHEAQTGKAAQAEGAGEGAATLPGSPEARAEEVASDDAGRE
jgi:hypothetical protein